MKLNKRLGLISFILCLFIAGAASFNLFTNNGFSFHDETQIANLFEYKQAIGYGQIPPRWAPDMQFTYGSPYLEFNYQIPYYFGVVFNHLGLSLLDSYKLVLALSFFVGAIGMYLLGQLLAGPLVGLATAFLYTFTPYRAVDVYVRGTVGEALAIGIFPWIFYALYSLRKKSDFVHIFLAGLSISILILTHQPATAFGLPVILLIFVISEIVSGNYKYLLSLLWSLLIAFGLSAYYLIPVLLEQKFIQPVAPFNFYDHFPFIKQLIYSAWGYGVSIPGPYDGFSFQIGLANLVIIILGVVLAAVFIWKKGLKKNIYLIATVLSVALVLFLMNMRSSFLWSIFPYTNSIQFPWRLLSIMVLLTTLLYLFILAGSKNRTRKILLIAIPLIALINNFSYFHPGTIIDHDDNYYLRRYLPNQVLFIGEKVSGDYLNYTENYLPLPTAAVRPTTVPDSTITAKLPETEIKYINTNPFTMSASIYSLTGDFVSIHRFYYPGWVITLDGNIQKITLDKNGAMVLFVDKGIHNLNVYFRDTDTRYLSNMVSLLTILISTILLLYYSKHKSAHTR